MGTGEGIMTATMQVGLAVLVWIATCWWPATALADATVDALRQRVYGHALAGEDEAALPVARELVAATEKTFGADHLETAVSLDALGDRLQKTGRLEEALTAYRRGLEIRTRRLEPGDPQVAGSHVAIASTLDRQGRFAEEAAELRKALSILGKALGPDHPDLVPLLVRQRSAYMQMGKEAEARIFYDRELEIRAAARDDLIPLQVPVAADHAAADPPPSPWTGGTLWSEHNVLGAGCYQQRDFEGALFHFVRAARLRPDLGEVHNNIATTLFAMDKLDDALVEFAEAVRLQPDNVAMRINLANSLAKAERFAEAEKHFRKAIEMAPGNAALYNNLAVSLFKQGSRQAAIDMFRKALAIDPNLRDAREGLEVAEREKSPGDRANGE
jgi:tetratricopeptide (TPR) repeat protein